jgi:hypothetical protein
LRSRHLNVSVTVPVRLPLLAMTVKAFCPAGVEALVVSVRTVLALVERVAGSKLALARGIDERPSVVRFKVPGTPPSAIVLKLNPSNENGHVF